MQIFTVHGMSCDHCAAAIKSAIATADPAAQVQVDLAAGKVTVTNETTPARTLVQAIESEGYQATPTPTPSA